VKLGQQFETYSTMCLLEVEIIQRFVLVLVFVDLSVPQYVNPPNKYTLSVDTFDLPHLDRFYTVVFVLTFGLGFFLKRTVD